MLQSLIIKNYALISELNIQLHHGFSVITGETGAGKSILLGAIGLLMGQRAETRMIKTGESRCLIEADFDLTGYGMDDFFSTHDLDFDGHQCIIRRELTATGKSRAFINDTPAQVSQLRELGSRLIDIHSQHQNLLLSQENFQLSVVDIVAHDTDERNAYTLLYTAYRDLQRQLHEAKEAIARGHEDEDYLRFQLSQLDELQLCAGKQAEYEQEAQVLEHAEDIKQALWTANGLLQGSESTIGSGVLNAVHDAQRQLSAISEMLPEADELSQRLESCRIELKDIAAEIDNHAERIEVDPRRLQEVTEWLSQLYAQQQKHHVHTENELLELSEDFRARLEAVDCGEERVQALQAEADKAREALLAQASRLTALRQKAAQEVERQMHERLIPLGIPNVKFRVDITERPEPDANGMDEVSFLFSANKNGQLQPITEVASGGEIARVMLSLKALISDSVSLPTIIFDEIDTGVSGHIAESMAHIMRQMGDGGRQVISITHLPQIAALGAHHYRVYKEDDETGTTSHIAELSHDERITELAHMLSGAQLTPAAIENAKALLQAQS